MDFWRQKDIVNDEKLASQHIVLVGLGGIGSPTAELLVRMGASNLQMFDDDKVEEHNRTSTKYRREDVGNSKVEATRKYLLEIAEPTQIVAMNQKFDKRKVTSSSPSLVISGLDSKQSRVIVWEAVKENIRVPLYIDGRMGAQLMMIYSVNPNDEESVAWYEEGLRNLDEDGQEEHVPCTNRAICYNTAMIAALICGNVKKFIMGERVPRLHVYDFVTNIYEVSR